MEEREYQNFLSRVNCQQSCRNVPVAATSHSRQSQNHRALPTDGGLRRLRQSMPRVDAVLV
jgi:hypothetical protein